jgi:DNA replication protein DnaC
MLTKTQAEVCPLCEGTGWKTLPARTGSPKDRRVTRCDCQLRARTETLLGAARIPRRYEHCDFSLFNPHYEGADPSLEFALIQARAFAANFSPLGNIGLLLVGKAGIGKTHLAVGILREIILQKGVPCLFCDYRELLKQIQNSYNDSVKATELDVLRPVFETDVLVLDDLGAVKPTEWVWDTVSLILNSRYNNSRTTIITSNFPELPQRENPGNVSSRSREAAKHSAENETLGDRITTRMLSRLHEMCLVVKMDGLDFRQNLGSARAVSQSVWSLKKLDPQASPATSREDEPPHSE